MKTSFLSLAISALLLCSCQQNKDLKEVRKVQQAAKKARVETGSFIHSETVEVDEPVAVYFHPDSCKLTDLEQKMGEKFFNAAEENMFQISSSRDYLLEQNVKVIETEAKELRFRKNDGSVTVIDLKDPKYSWGLFLFNGQSDPIQVDMGKPEKQYKAYMKK